MRDRKFRGPVQLVAVGLGSLTLTLLPDPGLSFATVSRDAAPDRGART